MARRKKSDHVKVNFKGVESRQTPPEGDYKVEVLEATAGKSSNKNDQIEFTFEISEGKYKGTKLWLYCPLQENSLWKLHALLTALGQEVPEDEMDIDLSELVGEKCVAVVTHETYNGRKRAKMTDFDSLENYSGDAEEDDDDEDEDDGKKSKSKKSSKKSAEPDYDDMDEDELRELYLERELGTKKAAKKLDEDELREALEEADEESSKKSKKKSKSDDDEDEDEDEDEKPAKKSRGKKSKSKSDDDEDDEDEDDEPKSKKGKGKSKKKAKKISRDDVDDMDEDELQELIDEHDLDVDLDDYKKLGKKVSAVIDALEEEDLLEDEDDD